MLEPQSPALFVLLIAMFGVLMWRTLVTRRAAFRVLRKSNNFSMAT